MNVKNIIIQILVTIWELPQILVAILMLPFLGKLKLIRYENFCWVFEASKMSGGISLGCFIFLDRIHAKFEPSIRHELGHVKQSHILGPLYLFVVGIPSILNAAFDFTDCYYDFFCENWANKLMDVKVQHNENSCFIYIIN